MDKVKSDHSAKEETLRKKAKELPTKSGCYLFKDQKGKILYVGKAKNLKSRVGSYFNKSAKNPKTEVLVSKIRDFDFMVAKNEVEAFVLENNLIKQHAPKYNIRLKDDKTYPYVMVDFGEPFPRLHYTRKIKKSGKKEFFGPFTVGSNISEILRILTKSFRLRDCSLHEFRTRKEPCLLYQMHQCSAPCVKKISKEDYLKDLDLALDMFKGEGERSLKFLEAKMLEHSNQEEFEVAAMIRDSVNTLKEFLDIGKQSNAEFVGEDKNLDMISYFVGEVEVDITFFVVRNGLLLGHKNFHFPTVDYYESVEDELMLFLYQYYTGNDEVLPSLIITSLPKDKREFLEEAFKEHGNVKFKSPGRKYKSLYDLTLEQGRESQRVRLSSNESVFVGLNKLKDLLGLRERPRTLECYDVAIWQGTSPTASRIVFREGKPEKTLYRYYHLKERKEGNNDFEMLKEVMCRRLPKGDLPDVFVVDGGKGQVNAFLEVLKEFKVDIPVVGIAKERVKKGNFQSVEIESSDERLVIPGRSNPYVLKKNPSLFRLIVSMRDEAHRFSRKLHHKAERERLFGQK